MVEYKCKKCNKVFTHYGNYTSHMTRLFPCNEVIEETPPKKKGGRKKVEPDYIEEPPEEFDELVCQYCNKKFSRKDVCLRHQKSNCKNKKSMDEKEDELKIQTIINNFQTVNNFQTINNIQQNININSTDSRINPFGKEDTSFLTHSVMKNILKNPDNGIPQLIRLIHFNPEIPQNQNVRLKNKKEPYINVFNGENWELRDKDDTIQDLIISKKEIADDYLENLLTTQDMEITKKQEKIINAITQKKYETYTEAIDEYLNTIFLDDNDNKRLIINKYRRLYDKLYKQISLILLNNLTLQTQLENKMLNDVKEPSVETISTE